FQHLGLRSASDMPDESSEITANTDEVVQASSLLQRLDRRRTQPIGLADVRQFQPSSSRLPMAIAQRFALLDQLQTRYGVQERGAATTSTELSLSTPSQKAGGERTHSFTSQAPISRSAVSTTSSAGQSSSPQMFRVSRKAIPLPTNSALPLPLTTGGSGSPARNAETGDGQSIVQRSSDEGLPIARARVIANSFTAVPAAGTIAPLVLQKAVDSSSEQPIGSAMEGTPVNTEAISTPIGLAESFPKIQAQPLPLVVQRQPAAELIRNQNLTAAIASPPENRVSVSREIPFNVTSQSPSTMVLRKSMGGVTATHNGTNQALPLAVSPAHPNEPLIARQGTSTSGIGAMPSARASNPVVRSPMPTAGTAPIVASEINVAQIAEQVSRTLCRQLTVERERRGMRK
ncbi:MAG: hypothetical protein WCA35_03060, partial [Kovacikia sp.]